MLVIGLTGGIGSGKSTLARLFAEYGTPVIDADIIARELTQIGKSAYQKIIQQFGSVIVKSDNTLDRNKLRELIFNHKNERLWLEKLLHPLIVTEIENQIQLLNFRFPYCLIVIPLLIETGPYSFINRILVVDTTESLQIQRLEQRDKMKAEMIQKIIKTQAPRQERISQADDIIINNGKLEDLTEQVKKLHQFYLNLAQS